MTRFLFLDWMRGLAVLVMIQCHVFNSFTRLDARHTSAYTLTQFVGGMAAPLFLFMAGMTSGFQMERLGRSLLTRYQRWRKALRRAAYILLIAYLFRLTNWLGAFPNANLLDLLKVDILNCMGLAMAVFSLAAVLDSADRIRWAILGALLVAATAPVVSALDLSGLPSVVRYYVAPGLDHAQFPFFPCAAYLGFGLAAGCLVKSASSAGGREPMHRLMRWMALAGFASLLAARYFANLPFSIYPHADFWRNSPALIVIRTGIMLMMLACCYLLTHLPSTLGWGWIEKMGKTSLLVYWVHVMLVYGVLASPLKRALMPAGSALAVVLVTLLMIALAHARLRQRARQMVRWKAATTVAGGGGW